MVTDISSFEWVCMWSGCSVLGISVCVSQMFVCACVLVWAVINTYLVVYVSVFWVCCNRYFCVCVFVSVFL